MTDRPIPGETTAKGWTCRVCWMRVPAGWRHDCGGKMKRSRNVENADRPPDHHVEPFLPSGEPDDLEHRRIPVAAWLLAFAALTAGLLVGWAL